MRFGVSTHLYHHARLDREHLVEIAAHGFDCVEVFATRTHFDYHDLTSIQQLAEWLAVRRKQLAAGELMYIAHQIDYCGRAPG